MSQSSPFPYLPIVERPPIRWPDGARLAVWVIPNIEHFHADAFLPDGPDVRNFSRRDYGNRVGIWRLMNVMARHNVRGTVALNSEVCEHYPQVVRHALELGWELMGHGLTNSQRLTGLPRDQERRVIEQVKEALAAVGQPMRGWLGPGLTETWDSPDLLKEAGVEYVCDWVNDDLPYRMNNGLVSIPYTIELNDMPLFNSPLVPPQDFYQRMCDSFDVLYEEGRENARVMAIALHPFLTGSPHRIGYLDRALAYIGSHEDVWLATGHEIVEAYASQVESLEISAG